MRKKLLGLKRDADGRPLPASEVLTEADIERFWSHAQQPDGPEGCWVWDSMSRSDGYGEFRICQNNQVYRYSAHRLAYELGIGFPEACKDISDMIVRHKCDNRKCVNPLHLTAGSHADNVADRVERGRSAKGTNNGRSKLTPEAVMIARYCMDELGISHTTLAKVTGMDPTAFKKIKERETWKEVA